MVASDITLDIAKNYLRVDGNADNALITSIISAAKEFACSFTGLTSEELDGYEDIPLAILSLIADMYDVRQATLTGTQLNPTVYQILGSHSKNLLPKEDVDEIQQLEAEIAEKKKKLALLEKKRALLEQLEDINAELEEAEGDGDGE